MRLFIVVAALAISTISSAQDTIPTRSQIDFTIDRGLSFLAKDAIQWKKDHNCASCHHAGLVICAMHEAKQFGHSVDETVLTDLAQWVANSGDGKFAMIRPAAAPKAASPKAIYFSLALAADPALAHEQEMKLLLKTVLSEQTENGSWSAWPATRPPIFGNSDESLTALATLAVIPAATAGDTLAVKARDQAVKWLSDTKSDDDPQSIALRLVLWTRLELSIGERESLVASIRNRQNPEGGWSQTNQMQSDAWATGQMLYALAYAGIPPNDLAILKAHTFLIGTQQEDGSWQMTSRPTEPGGKGSTNLIPITGAGSAWAVQGLARSAGAR